MKKQRAILLTDGLLVKLKAEAEITGNSENSIIRTALSSYFNEKENKKQF